MSTTSSASKGVNAPPRVLQALDSLASELSRVAGKNLVSLLAYGPLARGRLRAGRAANVAVVLESGSADSLAAIAGPLRIAFRAARIEPLVLTASELRHASAVFPTKFLALKRHHRVLVGKGTIEELVISRDNVRLRVEQELRNLALRLRRRFLAGFDDPHALALSLEDAVEPLEIALENLLWLAGEPEPESSPDAVLGAAARVFSLDGDALSALAAGTPSEDVGALYARVLATVERAAELAERLEAPGRVARGA